MKKVITDRNRIQEIFNRGVVVNVLPTREGLIERMVSGERLRVYIGVDPTSSSLHLSHAKNYMFLEELRQLGHEVIVLMGDFTARIGDPSDRTSARKQLSEKEIKENVAGWLAQIQPLMDFKAKDNPPRVLYNSKWLRKLSFKDVVELAANFTVQQMLERDMFQKRLKDETPIHLHEFLYPLMQGYDSVAMDVDIELCGIDQTFNALAGRTLVKRILGKEKFVITVNLMENPKTGELMSKSRGNGVFLSAGADDMYGQIMAQPDEMIEILFVNCTRIPLDEVKKILALGPREAKAQVALEIVKKFYGEKKSQAVADRWENIFSKKEISAEDMPELKVSKKSSVMDLVMASGIAVSKSEARRLIGQGAVSVNDKVQKDWNAKINFSGGEIVKIGKRHFFKIKI